jgi:hypothetical protein
MKILARTWKLIEWLFIGTFLLWLTVAPTLANLRLSLEALLRQIGFNL